MVSRRSLLAAICLTTLALLGCSSGGSSSGSPSGSGSGAPAAAPKPGKELLLFGWSEYVPESLIDGFTKETGIEVHYETYASNEEMLSKLLAGGTTYDLIQPT